MPESVQQFLPILGMLVVVALVIARLPKIDLGHSPAFRRRRARNWLPVGLLYAFLYMGRYNLTVAKGELGELMSNEDFGFIFGIGTAIYGCAFLVNGPLTDRLGGKTAILIGAAGATLANLALGFVTLNAAELADQGSVRPVYSAVYGANMYFQSFGAVAIVKINAPWFHVRERGVFGAIFGILISLGIYFAFDWGGLIVDNLPTQWVFFIPAGLLALFWLIVSVGVKNTPGGAGFDDFDTADASSGDDGPPLGVVAVFAKILTNPIIVTIAFIEFCSGFLRQAIMHWFRIFAKDTGQTEAFVYQNWGMLLCVAGILGGVFAGTLSDHVFHSRRGPVAAVLYGIMVVCSIALVFILETPWVGPLVIFMSMAVIGVHGMLSGTASMDFGGRKNAGIAVGVIDGFVYAGTAVMSFTYGAILPSGTEEAAVAANWSSWPIAMVPVAVLGFVLALRVWNAKPVAAGGK